MSIRSFIPCLLVAVFAVAAVPERGSAQCWECRVGCSWGIGEDCVGNITSVIGYTNCVETVKFGFCKCWEMWPGFCIRTQAEDPAVAQQNAEAELRAALAAIKAGEPIPPDGSFVYLKRGSELVVRRRCDMAEMARVAIAEVEPNWILAGG